MADRHYSSLQYHTTRIHMPNSFDLTWKVAWRGWSRIWKKGEAVTLRSTSKVVSIDTLNVFGVERWGAGGVYTPPPTPPWISIVYLLNTNINTINYNVSLNRTQGYIYVLYMETPILFTIVFLIQFLVLLWQQEPFLLKKRYSQWILWWLFCSKMIWFTYRCKE